METINDILREMRKDIPRVVDAKVILRNYADRLEAAHKRESVTLCNNLNEILNEANGIAESVTSPYIEKKARRIYDLCKQIDLQDTCKQSLHGNNAKTREALNELLGLFDSGLVKYSDSCDLSDTTQIQYVIDKADEALAAPPRNCDRFVNETAAQIAFLREMCFLDVTSLDNDPFDCWTNLMQYRYAKWLLDEAEGECNGSK